MKRLYAVGLLMILSLVGAGYSSHMLSSETRVNISGVFDVDGRNWTAPNATEIFNFTVVNDATSNDTIVSINITVPLEFTLINTTIGHSLVNWNCSNSSLTRVHCFNASGLGATNGSLMYVWFNVTASDSVVTEQSNSWTIDTVDSAGQTNVTTLYSTIDGNVTERAELDALDAYVNSQPVVLNWTNHSGGDNISGILNYSIYNSTGGAVNFTVFDTTVDTNYSVSGLAENQNHSFIVETRDNAGNALNSSLVWTVIDTDAPSVYLNTTNNENFTDTYYPRLYFNATDSFDANMSCEVFVEGYPNGTAYILNSTPGLSIQVNTSLLGESMKWYVNCTDDAGNSGNSSTRVLNVVGADVVVDSVYFNTTADTNPVASDDMKVFAVVKNVGNMNISQNVTVKFYLDGTDINQDVEISNETLTAGQSKIVNCSYTGSLKQYSSTSFNHTVRAYASLGVTELNATNNDAYNYSLYVGYNVTITSIDSTRNPGENLTVNLMMRYPNGTGVTGIPKKNFTVKDTFSLTTITWGGLQLSKPTGDGWTGQNVYNDSFSEVGGGTYSFRISTFNDTSIIEAGTTRPGPHTVQVDIESNMTGRKFKGRSEDGYNLTAPMFDIIYKVRGESTDLNGNADLSESSSEDYNIYVVNNGHANLTSVNISKTSHDDVFSSVVEHNCSSQKNVPNDGSQVYVCYITVTTSAVDSDDSGEIDIVAYGSYNGNRYSYDEDDFVISVEDSTTTTTTTTETTTTGTTASDTDYPNCAVNDDCFGDEFCNSHLVCEELDCADDEKILDHACVKKDAGAAVNTVNYSLAVTDGPDELEIEHGECRNTTFKLKNGGEKTLTELKFELKLKDATVNISEWYDVLSNYSTTLKKGIVESVKVEINTADFSIGVYEIIAFAKSDKASGNMTFTLKVTPDDDEKVVINDTMAKLDSDYTEIYNQLQVLLHENVNNTNLTGLNDTLEKVAEYLNTAKLAIESGDYLSAYENQKSAESLIIEVKSKLNGDSLIESEKKSHWLRNSLIVVVLAVLGVFGFQYYRDMQESGGYHPTKGFRIKKKSEFREKIAGEISALKGSIKGKKEKSAPPLKPSLNYASYSSKKEDNNIFKRIIEKFSAKKQNANQKTLYDIGNVYNKNVKKKKVFCY